MDIADAKLSIPVLYFINILRLVLLKYYKKY